MTACLGPQCTNVSPHAAVDRCGNGPDRTEQRYIVPLVLPLRLRLLGILQHWGRRRTAWGRGIALVQEPSANPIFEGLCGAFNDSQ